MNTPQKFDMREALRLTREGRLKEAVAALRGPAATVPPAANSHSETRKPGWSLPPILDNGLRAVRSEAAVEALRKIPETLKTALGGFAQPGAAMTLAGLKPAAKPEVPTPEGARFETRQFANAAGSRAYRLYIPSSYNGEPVPLVVMLHGCIQSPEDFAVGTRMNELAERQNFLVAYPGQTRAANATKCWNWFKPEDQRRDQGEPSLIAGITREIMDEFAIRRGQVYVAGLSAGGATAAVMGALYPDLYAAIGVHSGLACGAASDLTSAMAAMRNGAPPRPGEPNSVPTIVFHGDHDTTVNPVNADQVIARSQPADVIEGKSPGGIGYTRKIYARDFGRPAAEQWVLHGAGHAWSGGSAAGSFTEPRGPDASAEMLRFFREQAG